LKDWQEVVLVWNWIVKNWVVLISTLQSNRLLELFDQNSSNPNRFLQGVAWLF